MFEIEVPLGVNENGMSNYDRSNELNEGIDSSLRYGTTFLVLLLLLFPDKSDWM